MKKNIVEYVYDIDEFMKIVDKNSRVHYMFFHDFDEKCLTWCEAGIVLFGVSKERHIVKCEISRKVSWTDKELDEKYKDVHNLLDRYNLWIHDTQKDLLKEIKEKLLKEYSIEITPGKYEYK